MQLMADMRSLRHRAEQLFRSILRMAGHKPQTIFARHGIQPRQQIGEIHADAQILAIRIDILSEQRDIFIAFFYQAAQLCLDVLRLPAALSAAHIRHDAIGAEIVAAVHNGQPCMAALAALYRQTLGNFALRVTGNLKNALTSAQTMQQQLRKAPLHMRAKHNIHARIALFDFFRDVLLLYHTAAHANDQIVAAVFQMRVLAHHAEHALFRMLPHGAGVDNDHVRLGIILGSLIAHVAQHTGNALGIRLILLTAEGLAEKPLLLRQQRIAAAHLFDILQLMRNLLFWNLS